MPLWSSGQSSWLQIQRPGFDFRRYQIFWEVVGLQRGPLSPVSTTEELIERKSSGSGLEIREYGHRDPSRWPRSTLYPQKLALTSPTSGGHSVCIVRSRTKATEFFFLTLQQISLNTTSVQCETAHCGNKVESSVFQAFQIGAHIINCKAWNIGRPVCQYASTFLANAFLFVLLMLR
jgi:hypothetical protein